VFGNQWGECISKGKNNSHKQIKDSWAPFFMGVHHVVHRTTFGNLKSPRDLTFIARIEVFMMNMYGYFNHSPKRHLKFYKLTQIWKVKGSKILKNVKTRWMSMLEPLKNIMVKYHIFLLVVMKLIVIQPMCQR
jgi:hypothetical protein